MAHTFDELVTLQRTADQAHARVLQLRDEYGRPTAGWTSEQTAAYDAAWVEWRGLAADSQAAVTVYAKAEGKPRDAVEADVKRRVWHPEPEPAAV